MYRRNEFDNLDARCGLSRKPLQMTRGNLKNDDEDINYLGPRNIKMIYMKDNPIYEYSSDEESYEERKKNSYEKCLADENDRLNAREAFLQTMLFQTLDFASFEIVEKTEKKGLIYGHDLTRVAKEETGFSIPLLVLHACSNIEKYYFELEGIYRTSSSTTYVDELIKKLSSKHFHLGHFLPSKMDKKFGHTLAYLVKKFFLELKEPLVSYDIGDKILGIVGNKEELDEETIRRIHSELGQLSKTSYDTFAYFIGHLARISKKQGNFMDARNLAIACGPFIFKGLVKYNNLIAKFIDNYAQIFS